MSEPTDPRGLIRALTETDDGVAALTPAPEDFAGVFLDGDAWAAAYAAAFPSTPEIDRQRGQVVLDLLIGRIDDPTIADRWPGGLHEVLSATREGTVWCQWTYRLEGERRGVTYNALAWAGARWVWLPKPWRWAPGR